MSAEGVEVEEVAVEETPMEPEIKDDMVGLSPVMDAELGDGDLPVDSVSVQPSEKITEGFLEDMTEEMIVTETGEGAEETESIRVDGEQTEVVDNDVSEVEEKYEQSNIAKEESENAALQGGEGALEMLDLEEDVLLDNEEMKYEGSESIINIHNEEQEEEQQQEEAPTEDYTIAEIDMEEAQREAENEASQMWQLAEVDAQDYREERLSMSEDFIFEQVGSEHSSEEEKSRKDYESVIEEGEESESDDEFSEIPFNFRAYVKKNLEFFKKFKKINEDNICGEDDVFLKIDVNELITGFKGPCYNICESAGLKALTGIKRGVSFIEEISTLVQKERKDVVAIVSGGRSGKEPLYVEYVGAGMLTAAILGTNREAPSVSSVYKAIIELSNPKGILIILENDAEYRLVFGMAMEQARMSGVIIDIVTIGDDCWEKSSSVGRKGCAGIILAIKIAGCMSEAGKSMKEIYCTIRNLKLATISGLVEPDFTIGSETPEKAEFFKGSLNQMVTRMLSYPLDQHRYFSLNLHLGNPIIVLINSFQNKTMLFYTVAKLVVNEIKQKGVRISRLYADNFYGGKYPGFSVTCLSDEDSITKYLDAATSVGMWPRQVNCGEESVAWLQKQPLYPWFEDMGPTVKSKEKRVVRSALIHACKAIVVCEQMLNTMHMYSNYGTKLKSGAEEILRKDTKKEINYTRPFNMLVTIAKIFQEKVAGSIGAMYACLFYGAAQFMLRSRLDLVGSACWAGALDQALRTLRAYTGSKAGVVSLALTLVPVVQSIYGPQINLSDHRQCTNPVMRALDSLKEAIEERARNSTDKTEKEAVLKNQLDVESYAMVIWLHAVFGVIYSGRKDSSESSLSMNSRPSRRSTRIPSVPYTSSVTPAQPSIHF